MERSFCIMGDPIPLARCRYNFNGNHKIWDSQKELKTCSRIVLEKQQGQEPIFENSLHLDITFFMGMPQNWSKRKRIEMNNTPHHFRPDLDNMVKFICDIANGLLYKDDSCISKITAQKIYSPEPKTTFTLIEI